VSQPGALPAGRRAGAVILAAGAVLLAAAFGGIATARAASSIPGAERQFADGNAAYEARRYDEAVTAYEKVLGAGLADPRVYFNLGNAQYRLGQLGLAIVAWERAVRLDPADDDVRANLELARGQIRDRVGEPELQYPIRVVKEALESIPAGAIAMVFLALYVLAAGGFGLAIVARDWFRRRLLIYAAAAMTLGALCAGTALLYRARQDAAPIAIVLVDKIDVRSGPGEENTILFTVHEGTRVDLRSRLDLWVQVGLPNGLTGWVPATSVEKV
jgi:tetratricopeptide (TPR) repeat protein